FHAPRTIMFQLTFLTSNTASMEQQFLCQWSIVSQSSQTYGKHITFVGSTLERSHNKDSSLAKNCRLFVRRVYSAVRSLHTFKETRTNARRESRTQSRNRCSHSNNRKAVWKGLDNETRREASRRYPGRFHFMSQP